jgi:hypothetical protein
VLAGVRGLLGINNESVGFLQAVSGGHLRDSLSGRRLEQLEGENPAYPITPSG